MYITDDIILLNLMSLIEENMKISNFLKQTIYFSLLIILSSCGNKVDPLIKIDQVSAWCMIGFDSEERTPQQRIELL